MTSGTPRERRALRMYVKLTGPNAVRGGHTRRVGPKSGFVTCDPVFGPGDGVEMEFMVNPRHSAGLKVEAEIVAVRGETEHDKGVELRWRSAATSKSPAALGRFLSRVLGIEEPSVLDDGLAPYRYRYTFPDSANTELISALQAMKSRPMGRSSRRTVLNTDPEMGPEKLKDIIAAPTGAVPTKATEPYEVDNHHDTIPDLVEDDIVEDDIVEDDIVEDDLVGDEGAVPYEVNDSKPSLTAVLVPSPPVTETLVPSRPVIEKKWGTMTDERRLRPRITASVPVSFFIHSRGTVARAHNVSRSGLYIASTDTPPKVGSRVNVRFPVRHPGGNHVVLLTCEVVRHRAPREKPGTKHGFAVCYLVVDELGRTGVFGHFINQHT